MPVLLDMADGTWSLRMGPEKNSMPRKHPREQAEELAATLAWRRLRRRLFPELVSAFWPNTQPLAEHGQTSRRSWWRQAVTDEHQRLVAAVGEIADA